MVALYRKIAIEVDHRTKALCQHVLHVTLQNIVAVKHGCEDISRILPQSLFLFRVGIPLDSYLISPNVYR